VQNRRLRLSLLSALALASATPAAFAGELVAKQLAGPPAEFAQMARPNPADAAIHSKAALLSVEMSREKSGRLSWTGQIPVEGGRARMIVFSNDTGWQADIAAPGAKAKPLGRAARDARPAEFGAELAQYAGDYSALDGAAKGAHTLTLRANAGASQRGFVLVEGDSATQLASYQTHTRQLVGERIAFAATLTSDFENGSVKSGRAAGRVDSATLRVTAPDGAVASYPMFDDGAHADGAAGDGTFGGDFAATAAGTYQAQVIVQGANRAGETIIRTAEHVVPVVAPTLSFDTSKALAAATVDTGRATIRVPIVERAKALRHYRAIGQVWGHDAHGNAVPVAWIGGMVEPNAGGLALGLDQRWIALAHAQGPFELRDLRVEDPDHFVTVASLERMDLAMPEVESKRMVAPVEIDESMTMGARPADLVAAKGTGSRLLLIHGYCSGGVWPAAQFTNASTFLDVNQSRSNDQFARLIQSFGNTWNSYGTVSHSQGGMATLHLYTYYWSGLDNAVGSRLLQSVGTPYQGTNLAGILASLGSWFGVGCGTNDNLTYSGASAWLAGIPSWARAKVNYYTTSFRLTNWWTNDYCNFATDLVLSDPEDGTTEQAYGQLPGATNRGHVTGECHTSGMRDPAQYNDASRNSIMNTNAAR
jgi:hypothetical protein